MKRRAFVTQTAALGALATAGSSAQATGLSAPNPVVILWNRALTSAIASTATQATIAARAISMVNEALYNAWAAYDPYAAFTLGTLRKRPLWERCDIWKQIAISHAAHAVLLDLFPAQKPAFDHLLAAQVPRAWAGWPSGLAAVQVGQLAGSSLLQSRYQDGSNQRGDLAPGAYSDWTGYVPVNGPETIVDINRWQPLRLPAASGVGTVVQKFLTPQWGKVRAFALANGAVFRPPPLSPLAPTLAEMTELINYSANLGDFAKALVDVWAANPGSVSPPGQWMGYAEQVSAQDSNTLDEDVKLFFGTGQAVLDASIAAWDAKRVYDSVRPITAIRYYFRGQTVQAWGGPGLGKRSILGENWRPFQRPVSITPPFPEYVSGHSTFSASAATLIAGLRGSDVARLTASIAAASLRVDPGFPTQTVNFVWNTLTEAANSAGLSRRVGGIHFERGDLQGRALGRKVGGAVLARCQKLFGGSPTRYGGFGYALGNDRDDDRDDDGDDERRRRRG